MGRNRISFTSTSSGWLTAKATARANESAGIGGDPPKTATAHEMLAGANRAAVIRADGTAEIIHFRDVTATDAGTSVLSKLLRGRRGTEVYVALHQPGEKFVMLDDRAAILRRLLPLDLP